MKYDDSYLIRNLQSFADADDVDKFIRFPHLNVSPLHLVELIEECFHWSGIDSVYLVDDSKSIEIDGTTSLNDIFNIAAIDGRNGLYLFKDETDFYAYLEHDTYLSVLKARRYEVKEDEMTVLVEQTCKDLIERSERTIRAAKLRLRRLKGD